MNNEKPPVELSVIVCTRNRAKQLATLFQCLVSQKDIENLNWEIIIVDNNSTDNTKEVSYAFSEGSSLKVNYVFEPQTGLSYARNTGIFLSKGSLVLFVDDDILLPREFISNIFLGVKEFKDFHALGFRVLPDWQEVASKPFWLNFKGPLSLIQSFLPTHDLGLEALRYPNRKSKNPIGASFLVKRELFEKLGPFRVDLGAGSKTGLCEDTEFFWYAIINKFSVLYWPYAMVYHTVDPKRLTIKYLHDWYFNLGKSLYLVKNTGRIFDKYGKNMIGFEGVIANKFPPILETILLKTKIFNVSILLWVKFLLTVLLLPLSIPLLFLKRPFFFSTMLAKTLGEIQQAVSTKQNQILK